MVRITQELVRKKSEHNEGIISTLEELSLHQEDVEKIEHLNNWCKDLQILYLQANLISKIENLNKLKKLQYLNLALNNIEKIENLERCESLEKLDLTLNFIGDLESVRSLCHNIHLKELHLIGNPCCDFEGYRSYVVATLPLLENLDNKAVTRSEKIKARQTFEEVSKKIQRAQKKYFIFREDQKLRLSNFYDDVGDEEFWKTASENSPEVRAEIAKRSPKNKNKDKDKPVNKKQNMVRLFNKSGKPLNINQAKLKFTFCEEHPSEFILDIAVYKYLDTNLIEVDVQPIFVKVLIKGKVFQFVLPEEVYTDRSTAQRSQTTGHLVIRMPRVNFKGASIGVKKMATCPVKYSKEKSIAKQDIHGIKGERKISKEFLEVNNERSDCMDFSNIVENASKSDKEKCDTYGDVPPLQYGF